METPELKPCPFCGTFDALSVEERYSRNGKSVHWVECARCDTGGPTARDSGYQATRLWNARAEVKAEEKEPHICAKGRFGSSVMLSDGTKVCLNRGSNASVAEVWLSIEKAEQVVMMEEKGAGGR